MKLSYFHTADDLIATHDALRLSPWGNVKRLLGWIPSDMPALVTLGRALALGFCGLILTLLASIYLAMRQAAWWTYISVGAGALLAFIFWGAWRRLSPAALRKKFASDPDNSAVRAFEVDDAGFRYQGTNWECRVDWPEVRQILQTEKLVIITDKENAFFIPDRAFESKDARQTFWRFISDRAVQSTGRL